MSSAALDEVEEDWPLVELSPHIVLPVPDVR